MPSTPIKQKVVLTGFGPFGHHNVNVSYEIVKLLSECGIAEDVELVTEEIPVQYDAVQNRVPELWDTYKPVLMVHIGVSSIASELTIEQQAHNDNYRAMDVDGQYPSGGCCIDGLPECSALISTIDMKLVCDVVNESGIRVKAVVSHDPGRYLCDFIYYRSLYINPRCCAFIHVPPLNMPYTLEEMAEGVRVAILCMLDQVSTREQQQIQTVS